MQALLPTSRTAALHRMSLWKRQNQWCMAPDSCWRCAQTVALTFDDAPDPTNTARVLDALRDAGVKATFFVNTHNQACAAPDLASSLSPLQPMRSAARLELPYAACAHCPVFNRWHGPLHCRNAVSSTICFVSMHESPATHAAVCLTGLRM